MNEMDQVNEMTTASQDEEVLKLDPAPVPPEKKKSKKWLIGGALCALLVIAAVIVLLTMLKSPLGRLFTAGKNTGKAIERSALGTMAENLGKNGSISLKADVSKMGSLIGSAVGFPLALDINADITAYYKEGSSALSLDLSFGGKSLIDGIMVFNEKELAFASEALLGKTNYGVNLKNLGRNLENSAFDPAKKGKYALPAELYESLKNWNAGDPGASQLKKDAESLLDEAEDKLKDSLKKNTKVSQGSGSMAFAEAELKCTTVIIEADARATRLVAEDMLNWAKNSSKMTRFVDSIAQKMNPMIPAEEFKNQYQGVLKRLEEALPELENQLKDVVLSFTSYIYDNKLVAMRLNMQKDSEQASLLVKIGPDPQKPSEISLYASDPYAGSFEVSYRVSTNTDKQYKARLSVLQDKELGGMNIDWNKESGALEFTLEGKDMNPIVLNASLLKEKDVTTLELERISGLGENGRDSLPLRGISLVINESATFPNMPHYTEITSMSESQIDSVLEGVSNYFQGILGGLFGNLGGLFGDSLPFGN